MTEQVLEICVSFSQLCIFDSSLDHPFNDWSDRHFSQGFSWRPGSVSFRALSDNAKHTVRVFANEPVPRLPGNCVRAFRVPFTVEDSTTEIGSISDSKIINLPPGGYQLQVEFLNSPNVDNNDVNIRFNKGEAIFTILKADSGIDTSRDFDLIAKPAM